MIILVICYLVGWYIAKFFFPEKFILIINNANLIKVGTYISNNKWLLYICGFATSFLTYFLYLGACCNKIILNWQVYVAVTIAILLSFVFNMFLGEYATYYSIIMMIFFPLFLGANYKVVAIVFGVHFFSQAMSLEIRDLSLQMLSYNYASLLMMMLECYFWLLLFYCYFNYEQLENKIKGVI